MPKRPTEQDGSGNLSKGSEKQRKHSKTALYTASVVKEVLTEAPANRDIAILLRIKKCLDRANDKQGAESEVQTALVFASRLMAEHNVSQAQILALEESADHSKHGGIHEVRISRTDKDRSKPVRMQGHVSVLCEAITIFFTCKDFTTGGSGPLKVSFYGINSNARLAADAFEMVFNLIAEWALVYKGNGPRESYCLGVCRGLVRMAQHEKDMEEARAREAEQASFREKLRQEAAADTARLARLEHLDNVDGADSAPASASPQIKHERGAGEAGGERDSIDDSESDRDLKPIPGDEEAAEEEDEDGQNFCEPTYDAKDFDNVDINGDLDEAIKSFIKPEPMSPAVGSPTEQWPQAPEFRFAGNAESLKPDNERAGDQDDGKPVKAEEEMPLTVWSSWSELSRFRCASEAVADEVLKSHSIKLSNQRQRANVRDWGAYNEGVVDSGKIDVRGRIKRIKHEAAA